MNCLPCFNVHKNTQHIEIFFFGTLLSTYDQRDSCPYDDQCPFVRVKMKEKTGIGNSEASPRITC